jgi:hypothetical protein
VYKCVQAKGFLGKLYLPVFKFKYRNEINYGNNLSNYCISVQFYVFREVVQLIIYNIYDHKHLQEIMNKYYNKVCIFFFFYFISTLFRCKASVLNFI